MNPFLLPSNECVLYSFLLQTKKNKKTKWFKMESSQHSFVMIWRFSCLKCPLWKGISTCQQVWAGSKTLRWPFYESENVYSAGCYVRRYRMYSIAAQLPRATIMLAVRCLPPPSSKFTVMTSCRGLLRHVQPRARMGTPFIIHRAKNMLKSDGLVGHEPEFYSL